MVLKWFGVFWGGLGCFHGPIVTGTPFSPKYVYDRYKSTSGQGMRKGKRVNSA